LQSLLLPASSIKDVKALRQLRRQKWNWLYQLTAPFRPLPGALIIGAQKSGTTSLNAWLRHHPEVMWSSVKEIHYFDRAPDRSVFWYRSHFPLLQRIRLLWGPSCALEASPEYLYNPEVAARMKAVVPDVKLIVLLRNPVYRAISHYQHWVRHGWERRPASEALTSPGGYDNQGLPVDVNFYRHRGHYAEQLSRYFEVYSRDQFLIIRSESMFANPEVAYGRVLEFLGLSGAPLVDRRPRNRGSSKNKSLPLDATDIPRETVEFLFDYFKPLNLRLSELLPEFDVW